VIVTTAAAATASAGLVMLTDLAERIEPIDEIGAEEVPEPESGGPYTLLLLGGAAAADAHLLPDAPSRGVRIQPGLANLRL